MQPDNDFINNAITTFKTYKGLIEFTNNLNSASINNYARIHAEKEPIENGRKIYSRIGVVIQDYSKGTGDNSIRVRASLMPWEIKYLYQMVLRLMNTPEDFNYPHSVDKEGKPQAQTKIFGAPDDNGLSRVTMFRVARQYVFKEGKNAGEIRNSPWMVSIVNGKGKKNKSEKTGGFYMASNSFVKEAEAFIMLSDTDMFALISGAASFINIWEIATGAALVKNGIKAVRERIEANAASVDNVA